MPALNSYSNPRIEGAGHGGNAAQGEVYLDWPKALWTGGMFGAGLIGAPLTFTPGALFLFLLTTATSLCFGHSLGMHRLFIHRSYICPRWMEYFFVHLGVLVGLAGPLAMARIHDTRDWAQRQPDCHDYFAHRSVWYKDAWWQLFCSLRLEQPPDYRPETKIEDDPVYRWMERTWRWQQLPWAVLFFVLGGWSWVFWGICLRVTVGVLGHWLVGYFAHNRGQQSWRVRGASVQGFNVPFAALLTMGESWHNNHHAFPGSARLGLQPGQWDPGWWVLQGLKRVGLVSGLKVPAALGERDDLVSA